MYHQSARVFPISPVLSANVSPSSSPIIQNADSSPPSSPSHDPFSLDDSPPTLSFSHPFAASTKATKRLPHYEKKEITPPCTPPGTFTRSVGLSRVVVGPSRSLPEDDFLTNASPPASPLSHRALSHVHSEEHTWEDALRQPFDTGIGQIDLSNQRLKYIPPSIGDLAGFYNTPESSEQTLFLGRTLARVNTAPAVQSTRVRSFERTQSIKDSGKDRHVLKLYLNGNKFTTLPPELFTLKNLTVLSLRGNMLSFIPPDICCLTSLKELNISGNQLKFLPWQMRDMKLEILLVNPNPFMPEPSLRPSLPNHDSSPSRPRLRSRRSITRLHSLRQEAPSVVGAPTKPILSPVTLSMTTVPPLSELCFRLLLAPSLSTPGQTVLADYHELPLSDLWVIPENVQKVLLQYVPGILRQHQRFSIKMIKVEDQLESESARTGGCPNPAHKGRVFVKHASERFSWERRIAGVDVGGVVPLRWRGCLQACLDFLDEAVIASAGEIHGISRSSADAAVTVPHDAEFEEGSRNMSDVDMDTDVEMAVQAVNLESVHFDLDMDEFDD